MLPRCRMLSELAKANRDLCHTYNEVDDIWIFVNQSRGRLLSSSSGRLHGLVLKVTSESGAQNGVSSFTWTDSTVQTFA